MTRWAVASVPVADNRTDVLCWRRVGHQPAYQPHTVAAGAASQPGSLLRGPVASALGSGWIGFGHPRPADVRRTARGDCCFLVGARPSWPRCGDRLDSWRQCAAPPPPTLMRTLPRSATAARNVRWVASPRDSCAPFVLGHGGLHFPGGKEVKRIAAGEMAGPRGGAPPGVVRERIYVGIDVGYREHVAAAVPWRLFNPQTQPDGWKRVRTVRFSSDAGGHKRLQAYLDRHSPHATDFLVLLEPTGGYYGLVLQMYLLGRGYRVV